jgi:hypothetical protein
MTPKREAELRKKLNIPKGANVTLIDLDAQKKPPEVVTGGWTDTQIRGKTLKEIESIVRQNELAETSMETALASHRETLHSMRQVRARKLILGDG